MEVTVGLPVEWMRGVFEDCGVDLLEAVAEVVWGFRESPTPCDAMLNGSLSVIEGLGSSLRYHPGAAAAKVSAGLSRIFCTRRPACANLGERRTLFQLLRALQVRRRGSYEYCRICCFVSR
jgi:hypothetical protein